MAEALTPDERAARGKAARDLAPRRAHGEWEPSPARADPIDLLERQAATRVPELVPIRYGRMLASPFAFFRGSALIMASDLAATPRSGIDVQLCGDAHLSNFGVYGTPERRFAFDLNDFDETHPGPWEWDLKRLAASIVIAARYRDFAAKHGRNAVLAAVNAYRTAMRAFAKSSNLDVWYARVDVDELVDQRGDALDPATVARVQAQLAKARARTSLRELSKLTDTVDGEPRIVSDPPLLVPVEELVQGVAREELIEALTAMLREYQETLVSDRRRLLEQYRLVHFARKVVGVGSVGTRAWIGLLLGRDVRDPLFLQVKEAQASVLEPFLGPAQYDNHAERVVAGQRLMQAASDIFLGWKRGAVGIDGEQRDFYLRQLRDWKGSADIERMVPRGLTRYARLCGWTLARAHARSGDRIAIASYLGSSDAFDAAIAAFAELYADQNERDYRALVDAAASGRVRATTGI